MEREIKFRAWHEFAGEMMTSDNPSDVLRWKDEGQPVKLMQYTGLKDKNKNPIYEGDILYCHEYDSSDCGHRIVQTFKNAVVGFHMGSFYYYPKGNMQQPHQLLMYAYKPEIIGNIYEHSNLLNP